MTIYSIRKAVSDDLAGLAAVQLESWQRTYEDVLSEDYRNGAMAEDLKTLWTTARLERDLVLVAEVKGQVVGLSGVIWDSESTAYVDNLHVAEACEGQGVGRALMVRTAKEVLSHGRSTLHLTVVTSNARALGFYERLGGLRGVEIEDAMFGHKVRAYPIRWQGAALNALSLKNG